MTAHPEEARPPEVVPPPRVAVSRRERARAATVEEIKETALGLMRAAGTTDIRFSDIARVMGLTAPALYRYFADRDELLTAMVVDAFDDLASQLALARQSLPDDDFGGQLLAICQAYRRWAAANPQRFALIFGMPVAGYAAPQEGPTTEAAERAMANFHAVVFAAASQGRLGTPMITDVTPGVAACASREATELGAELPADTFQAMMHAWAALHGFTCLDAYGHFHWLDPPVVDELFVSQVRAMALSVGLPPPLAAGAGHHGSG